MTAAASILMAATTNRFSVAVSNTSVNGSSRTSVVITGSVTASAVGGQGPFTPVWSIVDTDGSWTINSPNSFTTSFTRSGLGSGEFAEATFVCTLTDAIGDPPATSVPVTAYAQNTL